MITLQPSIEVYGLRIDEPMTTVTDLLVSAVCFYAFYKLRKRKLSGGEVRPGSDVRPGDDVRQGMAQLYFRLYFLLMGIATFLGGLIGHGFLYALSFPWKLPGWIISMLSVAMIERSSIERAKPLIDPRVARFFLILNIVELLTIMTITMSTLNFVGVEFHSGYGLLGVVLPFHAYTWYKTRDKGSLTIIVAVLITSVAALVFMNKISIDIWFNHLDISHIFMAIGGYVFYRGALKLNNQ